MLAPPLNSSVAATKALTGIWALLLATFVLATLYLARDILRPLALATLLTFLLAPAVTRLERWLGRVAAVLLVVATIFSATGLAGWILTRQLVDLVDRLPDYRENISAKLGALRLSPDGWPAKLSKAMEALKRERPWASPSSGREPAVPPGIASTPMPNVASPAPAPGTVQIIEGPRDGPVRLVQALLAPLLGRIGAAALVVLLVVFMLLKREDLRGRLIRLLGQGRIGTTTAAMDDAGARVTRYLLMQLILNLGYGALAAIGLYFIGVPNAVLWGANSAVLRFIPYLGPWIGASMPVVLSLAVSPGWHLPLLTLGLFAVLELLSNNVVEPWLYGTSTGVSPVALILAAVCWTWLWGPAGLVLATPMTVCLVVMGRHIPRLSFLSIVLSDEEALTPAQDCYYRLLSVGDKDEAELAETYLKTHSLTEFYDQVLVPVISSVTIDHRLHVLDDAQRALIEQGVRDLVADLGTLPSPPGTQETPEGTMPLVPTRARRVYCLPARADRDALSASMIAQLLQREGIEVLLPPPGPAVEDLFERIAGAGADAVCISAIAPTTLLHMRHLCLKLRALLPNQRVVVGHWGSPDQPTEVARRLKASGADEVFTTLADAVQRLTNLGDPPLQSAPSR